MNTTPNMSTLLLAASLDARQVATLLQVAMDAAESGDTAELDLHLQNLSSIFHNDQEQELASILRAERREDLLVQQINAEHAAALLAAENLAEQDEEEGAE